VSKELAHMSGGEYHAFTGDKGSKRASSRARSTRTTAT